MMEELLFALLRLGVGNSTTEEEKLSDFIFLSDYQWTQLGELARKQGVLAIMLDGIEKLDNAHYGLTRELKVSQKLEWIGEALHIEQRNHQQMKVMNDLAGKWNQNGFRVMVMKGQTNNTLYPRPEHRTPGDIDCYLFGDYTHGNEKARELGAQVDESWYKHSVITYKGELFENHQFFVHTRDGKRGNLLERELEEALNVDKAEFQPLSEYIIKPPVQWDAMFLTYHACAHFVSEGLRLKQLLDWAMFIKKYENEVDWKLFYSFCERNHLGRFSDVATAICVRYLGVKIKNNIIRTESSYADKVLNSALHDDDYVFSSNNNRWKNRLHLVQNLFRYRWKYEDIYEESIYKQLWYYITGFLFKTESNV